MGLYMDDKAYKNEQSIPNQNQNHFQSNYKREILREQQFLNDNLAKSMEELKNNTVSQNDRWDDVQFHLNKLQQNQIPTEAFTLKFTELMKSNQTLAEEIQKQENVLERLSTKLENLYEIQTKIDEKVTSGEEAQSKMISHLENQEALLNKLLRKIDDFRSVISKRSNDLAMKIEAGYQSTSALLQVLLKGKDTLPLHTMYYQYNDFKKRDENKDSHKK